MKDESLPAAIARSVEQFGSVEAIVDPRDDVRLSYAELDAEAVGFACGLIAAGVGPGDRVAIWAPNSWRWVVTALGTWMAGGVLVPVNTRYRGEEARYLLARSGAVTLVVENGFLGTDYTGMLRAADSLELPSLRTIIDLGTAPGQPGSWSEFLGRTTVVEEAEARARTVALGAETVACVIFTSGTTGTPKGAMLAHGQLVQLYELWADGVGLAARDRNLVVLPMFHAAGLCSGIIASLMRGATVVTQPVFDAVASLRLIEAERITTLNGPPALFADLLESPANSALASLKVAITGSTMVPEALIERLREALHGGMVLTAYGLTESCGTVTMCTPTDDARTVASRCGVPVDGVEVRVVDASGSTVQTDQPGEVLVRGFNVMQGYFDDPDATLMAVEPSGWLHTGDVGILDERGYLRITDRIKDVFIVGGFNAYPAEIEQVLLRHPAVLEAAVTGTPDARLGEVGRAYVVLRPGGDTTEVELIDHCRQHLANFKVPRSVVVLENMPRGPTGKIVKSRLAAATSPRP